MSPGDLRDRKRNPRWQCMKRRGAGVLLAAPALWFGQAACGGPNGESWEDVETGEVQQAMAGAMTITECVVNGTDYTGHVEDMMRFGRIGSRSTAFMMCVDSAMTGSLSNVEWDAPGTFGPYLPCQNDAWKTQPLDAQIARLRTATVTPRGASISCEDPDPSRTSTFGPNEAYGAVNDAFSGNSEAFYWTSFNANFVTGTADSEDAYYGTAVTWHEFLHSHTYGHGCNGCGCTSSGCCPAGDCTGASECGYAAGAYDKKTNSALTIVAQCMIEVLLQSFNSSDCQSLSCAANEMELVRRYGQPDCECVPDVFGMQTTTGTGNVGDTFVSENESNDRFGESLAAGDFDGDGYTDLAVGTPGEGGNIGVVYLYRGSPVGLMFWRRISQVDIQFYHWEASTQPQQMAAETGDRFGAALASADFNADGADDLVIGAPGENTSGAVTILMGAAATGPIVSGARVLMQNNLDTNEAGDDFGTVLATGDFDKNGSVDLAVGTPGENSDAGTVYVFAGLRLDPAWNFLVVGAWARITQSMGGALDEGADRFGSSLATGDFYANADSRSNLAIGAPGEDANKGAFFVASYNPSTWVWSIGNITVYTGSFAAQFGTTLAAGDIISGNFDDLAVGSPYFDTEKGRVWLYKGTTLSSGLTYTQYLQDPQVESYDRFGAAIAIGSVLGEGISKKALVVGAPGERFGTGPREGRVVFYKNPTSSSDTLTYNSNVALNYLLSTTTDTVLYPEDTGDDALGTSLAVGNFRAFGEDLAIGAPNDKPDRPFSNPNAGAVLEVQRASSPTPRKKIDQVTLRWDDF